MNCLNQSDQYHQGRCWACQQSGPDQSSPCCCCQSHHRRYRRFHLGLDQTRPPNLRCHRHHRRYHHNHHYRRYHRHHDDHYHRHRHPPSHHPNHRHLVALHMFLSLPAQNISWRCTNTNLINKLIGRDLCPIYTDSWEPSRNISC